MTYAQHISVHCRKPTCPASEKPTIEVALVPEHTDQTRRKCWVCKNRTLRIRECDTPDLGVEL